MATNFSEVQNIQFRLNRSVAALCVPYRRTDMSKLTVFFRNSSANAYKTTKDKREGQGESTKGKNNTDYNDISQNNTLETQFPRHFPHFLVSSEQQQKTNKQQKHILRPVLL
jgi:hypothetical protein